MLGILNITWLKNKLLGESKGGRSREKIWNSLVFYEFVKPEWDIYDERKFSEY